MAKKKPPTTNRPHRSWRDYNDSTHRSFPELPRPESLYPSQSTVERACEGDADAIEIVNAWHQTVAVRIVEVLA